MTTPGPSAARVDGVLQPPEVARMVIEAMAEERFLILSHPQVQEYMQRKGRQPRPLDIGHAALARQDLWRAAVSLTYSPSLRGATRQSNPASAQPVGLAVTASSP